MSNHNYSQYSNSKKKKNPDVREKNTLVVDNLIPKSPEEVYEISEAVVEVKMEAENVGTTTLPSEVIGTVIDCAKLNVRSEASRNAKVIAIVNANDTLYIDTTKSDNEWLRVCTTDDVIGYCMRKFVNASL